MADFEHIVVDQPREGVSRITLNRPNSRNALNNILRGELYSTCLLYTSPSPRDS